MAGIMTRYGVILKKLDILKEAVEVLVEAVQAEPLHWGAWKELSLLISDKDMVGPNGPSYSLLDQGF